MRRIREMIQVAVSFLLSLAFIAITLGLLAAFYAPSEGRVDPDPDALVPGDHEACRACERAAYYDDLYEVVPVFRQ